MLWEMLYCVVFFILPLVGMFAAIGVKAFGNNNSSEEADLIEDVASRIGEGINEVRIAVGGNRGRSFYEDRMRPCEDCEQGALVIDFYAYRELGVIKLLKRRMYARDGPGDTS